MERLATPDDDFIEILWVGSGAGPLVIHCRVSAALRGLLMRPAWQTLVSTASGSPFFMRGCGTQPNRLVTAYHSGQTDDLRFFLEALCVRQSPERIYAVGFSLGANVLLKYLAESPDSPVRHAVAVSPPLDLAACAQRLKGRKPILPKLPAPGTSSDAC